MKTHGKTICGLFAFFAGLSFAHADQLTYYVYPAPLGISWANPAALSWSTLVNSLDPDDRFENLHTIGHVNFDLECSDSGIMTGQTDSDDNAMTDMLLNQGYGLGMLLADYAGRWETQQEIENDLPMRFETGMIDFIEFNISPATCSRIMQYLQEYQQLGYDKIYAGLQNRPRLRQGGGCSAFGESVLEIGGLMAPEWTSGWQHSVSVPNELIGGPTTNQDVSIFDLLFGFASFSWAKNPADGYALTFWDPARMFDWIHKASEKSMPLTGMTYVPVTRGNAVGIQVDASQVPTPTDGFWETPGQELAGTNR